MSSSLPIPDLDGDSSGVATVVSRRGTWHQASGEFILPVYFTAIEGVTLASEINAFAHYRSYFASGAGDKDPTGDLPLGPGWLDGLGDGILQGAQPGGLVTWVDALGATWDFDHPTAVQDPQNPLATIWVYGAQRGARLLHWDGSFYRELPDHTLIEYEPKPGTIPAGEVAYRVKRIFRGDRSSPRWQVDFVYGSPDPQSYPNLIRLLRIEGARGYDLLLSWTRYVVSSMDKWRVTRLGVTNPDLDPSGWDWTDFDVELTYDAWARLSKLRYPERSLHHDPSGSGLVAGLQSFKAEGLRFAYASSTDHRLTRVSRLLKTTDWSAPQVEVVLENTYQTATTWRLATQTDRPGHAEQRLHSFSEPAAQTLRWKDPVPHVIVGQSFGRRSA